MNDENTTMNALSSIILFLRQNISTEVKKFQQSELREIVTRLVKLLIKFNDRSKRAIFYTLLDTTLSLDAAFNESPICVFLISELQAEMQKTEAGQIGVFLEIIMRTMKQLPDT